MGPRVGLTHQLVCMYVVGYTDIAYSNPPSRVHMCMHGVYILHGIYVRGCGTNPPTRPHLRSRCRAGLVRPASRQRFLLDTGVWPHVLVCVWGEREGVRGGAQLEGESTTPETLYRRDDALLYMTMYRISICDPLLEKQPYSRGE